MTYREKLYDVRWQKKRLEIMGRDDFSCRSCYAFEGKMNVHHLKYLPGLEPWDYSNDDLITLCKKCHDEWHRLFDNNDNPELTFLVAKLFHSIEIESYQFDRKITNFLRYV